MMMMTDATRAAAHVELERYIGTYVPRLRCS